MKIFVLTGAGCSAESGLGTFRDKGGLWARFDPITLATPNAFARNPDEVHAFYNLRRRNLLEAKPHAAHVALAQLQAVLSQKSGELFLCTQNVDDLHERAGAQQVAHMHGELRKARCTACDVVTPWDGNLGRSDHCPSCHMSGSLRPHVVWFGETPLSMDDIESALYSADLFAAIGTSGAVYPAAGFVSTARQAGLRTCEINLEASESAHVFEERQYGPASQTVPIWVQNILAEL